MPYADEFDIAAAINDMANTLDQGAAGPMNWGQGPEGSEGTIDLGQNPSLQALQAALSGGGVDPLAGKEDFMQQNEPATDAAQAGADVNAFLEATRGSDIRRQEELGTTPRGPNTLNAPPIQGGDTRGDNPIDIIRSNFPWARSLPNNVLFNAARYPDYLRLLIESDAAGKALPLDMPASMAAEGSG